MSATDPFKPLLNRRLLADAIRGIDPRLDDEQRRIAASWSASAADGSLLGQKEKPLQAQFLSEVLGRLLGYHPLVGADGIHHMEPETRMSFCFCCRGTRYSARGRTAKARSSVWQRVPMSKKIAIEARHRSGRPGPMSNQARRKQWIDYLDVLARIKVLDLASGSGAFLVAAFDYLIAEYERVNRAIAELQGTPNQLGLFDLDRQILQQNLFGVDRNAESVEITKLSLWLKTARRDKPLNNLDANIRCGNSLVEPPPVLLPEASTAAGLDPLARAFAALPADNRAFYWRAGFPEVFAAGGFDIVIGNPPYVRQEALGPLKPYLAQ